MLRRFLLLCLLALAPLAAPAGEALPIVADPVLEARVLKLSEVLRCLVCQNQSIAESNADLALDLRAQVREQLAAGKSEDQVVAYLVARYGDFVLYDPPLKGTTLLLWAGPALLLLSGLGWLGWRLSRRAREGGVTLSAEQHARARQLLESASEPEHRQ